MIKQIRVFRQENLKDFEEFLVQHPDSDVLVGDYYTIIKQAKYILSLGDRKDLKAVQRPSEKTQQIPIIYAVFETEGSVKKGKETKFKEFTTVDNIQEVNKFLAEKDIQKIFVLPTTETTQPLDNYIAGEYGPVPDRSPVIVRSHKILIIYKE